MLVWDKDPNSVAHGEMISKDRLDDLADVNNNYRWKTYLMCWEGSDVEWNLLEDEALVEKYD